MKRNKLYYILFVLYILATAFVLYVNGIFTGNVASFLNLAINGVFLLVIGILFVICGFSFARLNRCTDEPAGPGHRGDPERIQRGRGKEPVGQLL